jgi:antitoxin component of RelBE/YafQ-DinJ toxin-antitoxin module
VRTIVYTCTMAQKRKPVTKDNRIVLRIDDTLKDQAQKAAFKAGVSLSDYLRDLLKKAVEK